MNGYAQFGVGFALVINIAYIFFPSMGLYFVGATVLFGIVIYQWRELNLRGRLINFFAKENTIVASEPNKD